MSKWKVETHQDAQGKWYWSHEPLEDQARRGHSGAERWETQADAQDAGDQALANHHEKEPEH
jgi:hypothetical protein